MRLSKKPVEKDFVLESDFGKYKITIRQARVGDDLKRAELMATSSLVITDQLLAQEIKQTLNPEEVRRYEIYLTLVDCDIEDEDEEGNTKPWFKFIGKRLSSQVDFEAAYNLLPTSIARAIHEKVREVNPQWNNVGEQEEGE